MSLATDAIHRLLLDILCIKSMRNPSQPITETQHVSAFVRDHQLVDLSLPTVRVDLWRADAIVPFEWLKTVDMNSVPTTHRAEKQALTDLLTRVEHETDIPSVTQTQIDDARGGVGDSVAGQAVLDDAVFRASPTLLGVLGRYPKAPQGRSRVATLMHELDTRLRAL